MDNKHKQKRMVYIYEENLDYYEAIPNKSVWFNEKLQEERLKNKGSGPQSNIEFVRKAVAKL